MIEIQLVENEIKPFETAMDAEMIKAIKHFEKELLKIRTGRAHTSLIEDIIVSCYGKDMMPLKKIASLAAPDARLLTIQPWDKALLHDIERALTTSDIGIVPVNDGDVIKLPLPDMSHARREDLIKQLGKRLEECKVAIRNVRKDFNNIIRDAKKDKKISENFFNRLSDSLQKFTDKFIDSAENLSSKKEKDIRSV
ncbi:MAG TPA: ribosome recycling factor [Candidatus Babeliales bacterium]|nr:ribosome recycling factor [Candidatus Babeliales bacterium]